MLMYPKEYLDFSQLIKKYIILNILLKVLEYDKKILKQSPFKLAEAYNETLTEIQWKIEKDLRQIKKNMRELGGTVIEEQQLPTVRMVKAKFRGFIYTHRFLNYLLHSESEKLFKVYAMRRNEDIDEYIESQSSENTMDSNSTY